MHRMNLMCATLVFAIMILPRASTADPAITTDREYNVIVAGDTMELFLSLDDPESPTAAELKYRVMDYYGQVLKEDVLNIDGAAAVDGKVSITALSDLPPGFYRVRAGLSAGDTKAKISTTLAVLAPRTGDSDLFFGLNRGTEKLLRAAGISTVRYDVSWKGIEREKGVFDFSVYDARISKVVDAGIEVLGILDYPPPWECRVPESYEMVEEGMHVGWESFPPKDIEKWGNYVFETVKHFRGSVKYWEIWNEPFPNTLFFTGGSIEDYVAIMKSTYARGKEACPECVFIGLGGTTYSHAQGVFAAGGYPHMDAASIHIYHYTGESPEKGVFRDHITRIYEVMNEYGGGKAVWLTEAGWPTHQGMSEMWRGNTEKNQADYLVRSMIMARSEGIDRFYWYSFKNGGSDSRNFEHNQGLLYHDMTPKPSYVAYSTLTDMLSNTEFHSMEKLPGGCYAALFSSEDNWVYAAWSIKKERLFNIDAKFAARAVVVNMMGARSHVETGKTGAGEISVTESPMYILLPRTEPIVSIEDMFLPY